MSPERDIFNWTIRDGRWWWYLAYPFLVAACTFAIRAAICGVRALKTGRFCKDWKADFRGSPTFDWDPTILGGLELLAYPILIQTGQLAAIGAWLGFKTVAQWDVWKKRRAPYNQFLIGNALVLLVSYLLALGLVRYVKG
jgi:hypothetical protein